MQLFVNVLCFAFGVVAAITALVIWAYYVQRKERKEATKKAQKEAEEVQKALDEQQRVATEALQASIAELMARRAPKQPKTPPMDSTDSLTVKERLRRAVELTAQQSKINRNNGPDFIMQHNELELEKLTVLKSIIADGFDPVITIRFNAGDQDMLLSSYIQSISKGLA